PQNIELRQKASEKRQKTHQDQFELLVIFFVKLNLFQSNDQPIS
ncbi:MAG: hypothetical protein ACI902_000736, partial [Psychroserpens sp.]